MTSLSRRAVLAAGAAMATPAIAHAQTTYPVVGKVERLDLALDALIDADAVVEEVQGGFVWSEGPVWVGGKGGHVLVSDPRTNIITRWSAKDGGSAWLKPSGYEGDAVAANLSEPGTNGLFLGRGGLVVADSGNRCIGHIDLKTKRKSVIVDRFEGKRFNSPNDLCVSPVDGSIYFTDPPYGLKDGLRSPLREMDYTGVFRVAPDNTVSLIAKAEVPNGVGISPDGRTLYHTDRTKGWVAVSLNALGESVGTRLFVDRAASGIMGGDSLKVDQVGNVWVSCRDGIAVIAPGGRRLGNIRLNDVVSNCELGGDGYLYMSSNRRLARVPIKARKLKI
ncbi:MAG: SMP-30/gluconolactonase/LRE family protein [Pseudomonadota bacterium]|uniref:SMP-30/gluconolactonase/LRE family protein n=1 Tax=Phenylobacterium sp. TaxID=1871053 RepID=UPI0025DD809E|nr:SMP-30/gluconolactonase/LRE family protein [Phenylobacterium sp.]MBT9473160.1 SMP-30/gluconolactonase/LRE family protein [Phenylobacterium sp.]